MNAAPNITTLRPRKQTKWGIFECRHVIPLGDTVEHDLASTCWCRPKSEMVGKTMHLFIHNATDGRQ